MNVQYNIKNRKWTKLYKNEDRSILRIRTVSSAAAVSTSILFQLWTLQTSLSPTKSLHRYLPFSKLSFSSPAFVRSPAWKINLSLISSIHTRYLTFSFLARKPSSSFECQILASIFKAISNQLKIPNLRNNASQTFGSPLVSMYTALSIASITSLNTFSGANAANARHG